jgi:hypothetical protein
LTALDRKGTFENIIYTVHIYYKKLNPKKARDIKPILAFI